MDPRMYPLAAYLREIRQDWPLHTIQTELGALDHLPYEQVAVAAVRTAVDPTVSAPRGIRKTAENESRRRTPPGPPRLCPECRRPHDPARPNEHPAPPEPESAARGAARAREALRAALAPKEPPVPPDEQLELDDDRDHVQRAAGDR